jgi:hypothetical protein
MRATPSADAAKEACWQGFSWRLRVATVRRTPMTNGEGGG